MHLLKAVGAFSIILISLLIISPQTVPEKKVNSIDKISTAAIFDSLSEDLSEQKVQSAIQILNELDSSETLSVSRKIQLHLALREIDPKNPVIQKNINQLQKDHSKTAEKSTSSTRRSSMIEKIGDMDYTSICQTAGYIIREKLTNRFKTINSQCSLKPLGLNQIEIHSGYLSPINLTEIRYIAKGRVNKNTLTLEKIKVIGVDKEFIQMSDFGF
ncbi:hypothetical protein J8L86_06815 [Shewanella sp. MMG014]|uniref:hypothetical protein n=1 Tax=Shewanella sp. MMG014 TaxID=2822691 RepID=UPI001B38E8EC|nr:hypothetical protein [Shewanella sp. MMG014]MBQ4889551.1 hypothetical protein [Shewanella sp. MMG014]